MVTIHGILVNIQCRVKGLVVGLRQCRNRGRSFNRIESKRTQTGIRQVDLKKSWPQGQNHDVQALHLRWGELLFGGEGRLLWGLVFKYELLGAFVSVSSTPSKARVTS